MNAASARVALITGAGSGIGRAVSLALAADGFELALVGRRPEPLALLADEIAQLGGRGSAMAADVSDEHSVRALFDRVHTLSGRLDLLFNNAGANTRVAPLEDLTRAEWQGVIDVNLTGAFLCTQQAFRLMKSQHPRG
ncbi:MAG TPA: SDR family NAD(P)-dependent oxidoreductase, partial [Steroidobacteraceae bacterium]